MSGKLLIIVGLIYLYVAAEQLYKGNTAMSVVYGSYAVSNAGLYLALK